MNQSPVLENLHIAASDYTPEIRFDVDGTFSICGKSYPENTFEFYAPVLSWLETWFTLPKQPPIVLDFELIYFNSSSSKLLYDLLDILDAHREQQDIRVNWHYHPENESAREAGEDFAEDFEYLNIHLQALA